VKITAAKLERATANWEMDTVLDTSFNLAWSEYLIHELCHAAVFGFHLRDILGLGSSGTLPSVIQDEFETYRHSPDRRMDLWSDLSECRALAVEQHVLEHLGWLRPIRSIVHHDRTVAPPKYRHTPHRICWPDLLEEASDNMNVMRNHEVHPCVERFYPQQVNRQRAQAVISWIREILKQTPETP
jgi:hypothetical protein